MGLFLMTFDHNGEMHRIRSPWLRSIQFIFLSSPRSPSSRETGDSTQTSRRKLDLYAFWTAKVVNYSHNGT